MSLTQINIPLGMLRHLAEDLKNTLEGVNIAELRISRVQSRNSAGERTDTISVFTCEGLLKEYDVKEIMRQMPMQEINKDTTIFYPTLHKN